MQQPKSIKTTGSLKISQEVIATIANHAAGEVQGVVPLDNTSSALKKIISNRGIKKTISINLNDDIAIIDMDVKLTYGTRIQDVAEIVQSSVKEAVQTMTGITVSKVNVNIVGIIFEEETSEE